MHRENKIEQAEAVALSAVAFIIGDETARQRFIKATGIHQDDIAGLLSQPTFLSGVLEFLLQDESLLLVFCSHSNLQPDEPSRAHRALIQQGLQFNGTV